MGQSGENTQAGNMLVKALFISMLAVAATAAPQKTHNLPVLFQFSQPGHNVAVFRGADLKKAIASGLVSGFGSLGGDGGDGRDEEDRDGRSDDGADAASYATNIAPAPPTTAAYAAPTTAAPTTAAPTTAAPTTAAPTYKPAPVVYRYKPAPVVYKPAPVVYKPVPAPVYKAAPSYAEPSYADIPAKYDWEYAVKDDYSNNDFGAKESRDGYLTNGNYYVALPDGRLQTVTYV